MEVLPGWIRSCRAQTPASRNETINAADPCECCPLSNHPHQNTASQRPQVHTVAPLCRRSACSMQCRTLFRIDSKIHFDAAEAVNGSQPVYKWTEDVEANGAVSDHHQNLSQVESSLSSSPPGCRMYCMEQVYYGTNHEALRAVCQRLNSDAGPETNSLACL